MNNGEAVKIFIPNDFEDEMEVITTIFNPTNDIGLAIGGENMQPTSTSKCPILRIFMLESVDQRWAFKEELQAFTFSNCDDAQTFLENLPQMSGLEMLIILNGQKDLMATNVGFLS